MKPTKKQLAQNINKIYGKSFDELLTELLTDEEVLELLDKYNEPKKVLALAKQLDLTLSETLNDIEEESDEIFKYGEKEFFVLTNDEADTKNEEYIDNYIDESILHELPQRYQIYFDNEAFKRDARIDGRGHNLAGYDGNEEEQYIESEWFYIYRTN
ncbi:MAG: hypothetical protein AABY22_12080 [Nanoarchaeota archaeon]